MRNSNCITKFLDSKLDTFQHIEKMCFNRKSKYFALINEQIVAFNTLFYLLFVLPQELLNIVEMIQRCGLKKCFGFFWYIIYHQEAWFPLLLPYIL